MQVRHQKEYIEANIKDLGDAEVTLNWRTYRLWDQLISASGIARVRRFYCKIS